MRTSTVVPASIVAGVFSVLVLGPLAAGSALAPARMERLPRKLDEMLEIALKSNPQVQLAEAKVHQAEAELLDVRLRVTQEILEMHSERQKKALEIDNQKRLLARAQQLAANGNVTEEQVLTQRMQLGQAEADLTKVEGKLRYLLGWDSTKASSRARERAAEKEAREKGRSPRPRRPAAAATTRAALARTIDVEFNEASLSEVIRFLRAALPEDVPLVVDEYALTNEFGDLEDSTTVNLEMKDARIDSVLLALCDLCGFVFVLRDYGVFMTTLPRAFDLYAATIPPDVDLNDQLAAGTER